VDGKGITPFFQERHMPESAIKTGCVDDIALPEDMPSIIEKYVQKKYKAGA
jgi:hypothetical protein